MKPKLYQYAACPFCNKVSSLLAYKKVEYDTIEVNPLNKKELAFSEDYRKVPIYIDSNGQQINDSNEIMKHLEEEFPEPKVYIGSPEENEKWLKWSETLVQGLPTVVYGKLTDSIKAFDYITKTGNFNWLQSRMIKYSGAFIMSLVAKKIRKRQNIMDEEQFLNQKLNEWVTGLNGRNFIQGEAPCVADITVFGIMRAVADLRAGKIFRQNQAFSDWFDRVLEATRLSPSIV